MSIKVSVLMVTYNHQSFISQALESVLMQRVNFDYEIVIGEDCSTDETRRIVQDYQRAFSSKIRLLLRDENVGMMRNFAETYLACQGEYIAILDGDDFWTSPEKLQKQVDFLDNNPDFAICFHNANYLWETEDRPETLLCPENQEPVTTIEDILQENFIPAVTCMFRNRLFGDFPHWFCSLKFGDWPLHILNAQYGKIKYLNESMARYRVHPGGVASGGHLDVKKAIESTRAVIDLLRIIGKHVGCQYKGIIRRSTGRYCILLGKKYEETGNRLQAIKYYLKGVACSRRSEVAMLLVGRIKTRLKPV